jgi:integrase
MIEFEGTPLKALTHDEITKLRQVAETLPKRDYVIIRLMIESGLRSCEINRMQMSQIKKAGIIRTETSCVYSIKVRGKWRKRYDEQVFISKQLMDAIGSVCNMYEKWAFPGNSGAALSTRRIRQIVKNALIKAGLKDHTAHHLRHTYAHLMFEATGDLKTLKKQLRHKSEGMTAYYAGVFEKNAKNTAEENATIVDFDAIAPKTTYRVKKTNKEINKLTIEDT